VRVSLENSDVRYRVYYRLHETITRKRLLGWFVGRLRHRFLSALLRSLRALRFNLFGWFFGACFLGFCLSLLLSRFLRSLRGLPWSFHGFFVARTLLDRLGTTDTRALVRERLGELDTDTFERFTHGIGRSVLRGST